MGIGLGFGVRARVSVVPLRMLMWRMGIGLGFGVRARDSVVPLRMLMWMVLSACAPVSPYISLAPLYLRLLHVDDLERVRGHTAQRGRLLAAVRCGGDIREI